MHIGRKCIGAITCKHHQIKNVWADDCTAFKNRSLKDKDYVYIFADGVHLKVRLNNEKLCLLVIVGVTTDGRKEVIAVDDGYRESKDSWAMTLRRLSKNGMKAPNIAMGDGALGFWAALSDVWPETKGERCWVNKIANVLDKLPKGMQPKAKEALHEMMYAPDRNYCLDVMDEFEKEYSAKYPKAVECLLKDKDTLTAHIDFPAEHRQHIRTTNPIESTFSTVRFSTRVTKGAGYRNAGLPMAFKLLEAAQTRWKKIRASHLAKNIREGVVFKDGIEQEKIVGRVAV